MWRGGIWLWERIWSEKEGRCVVGSECLARTLHGAVDCCGLEVLGPREGEAEDVKPGGSLTHDSGHYGALVDADPHANVHTLFLADSAQHVLHLQA
jgi:hypothetical protein